MNETNYSNMADVRYVLNGALYYYNYSFRSIGTTGAEIELFAKVNEQIYPNSLSPMSNILLRVKGLNDGRIDRQFFHQCLSDIEKVGESLAHNRLLTRLTFHHFLRHQNINQFVREHTLTIVYRIPNTVHIAQMPHSASATGVSFGKLLTLAILEKTCTAASEVYVMEGLRPQDLLDKANP